MTENEFMLQDRISKIQSINELYDLENNAYVSFSGGKDSTVLHYLIDEALPGNKIPRVYFNTGIEYLMVVSFVERERERDNRVQIINSKKNIRNVLQENGYPFKSKEHSLYLSVFQNSGFTKSVNKYLNRSDSKFACPQKLRYQFTDDFKIKVSNKCCFELKKKIGDEWRKENKKTITITGMRQGEGGLRASLKGCTVFTDDKNKGLKKFHPLFPCNEDFVEWYIKERNIKLCELYYPPFNFNRTGCKGCPYSTDLQKQLDVMEVLLPAEKKQCEMIWKPVYEEYRRLGYRLRSEDYKQLTLF